MIAGFRQHLHLSSLLPAQDLSGFVDGTRNPHFDGVALETAPIPEDVDPVNMGGSYLYAGLFLHDLDAVRPRSRVVVCAFCVRAREPSVCVECH